jgi:preprotein translocase subunit SecD
MRRFGRVAAALAALVLAGKVAEADPLAVTVLSADLAIDPGTNEPVLSLRFDEASAKAFADLTRDNVGKVVELRVDGKVVMSPIVREPIVGGSLRVSGPFPPGELKDMAARLSAGTAKVEVEVKAN